MDTHTAIAAEDTAQSPQQLDELAHWVASRLEVGETGAAWSVTVALEQRSHLCALEPVAPSLPVIGRRFASAHRGTVARLGAPSARVAA